MGSFHSPTEPPEPPDPPDCDCDLDIVKRPPKLSPLIYSKELLNNIRQLFK